MRTAIILLISCLAFIQASNLRAEAECATCVPVAPRLVAPRLVAPAPRLAPRVVRRIVAPPVQIRPTNVVNAPKVVTTGQKVADMSAVNKNNYLKSQPHNYYVDARRTNYIDARRNNMVSNKDGDDINVYDAHRKYKREEKSDDGGVLDDLSGIGGLTNVAGKVPALKAAADAQGLDGSPNLALAPGDGSYTSDAASVRNITPDMMNP